MEASRAEYMANDKFKQQLGRRESSTSDAEPSSSGGSKHLLSSPFLVSCLQPNLPLSGKMGPSGFMSK